MKRVPLPVAILIVVAALAFAWFRYSSSFALPRGNQTNGPAPTPEGHGPTPDQLQKWATEKDKYTEDLVKKIEAEKKEKKSAEGKEKR